MTIAEDSWLHAWTDPAAGLKTLSQCMVLADTSSDGDYRCIIVSFDKNLHVYRGTTKETMMTVLDSPVVVSVFYVDRVPSLAIASGPCVYIYRKFRPYLKFTLPAVPITETEGQTWKELWQESDPLPVQDGVLRLLHARAAGAKMSPISQELLACNTFEERVECVTSTRQRKQLGQQTMVTCMDVLNVSSEGDHDASVLVIGTESGQIMILDSAGSKVALAIQLPSVPALLTCYGLYALEYRISVACRDGVVYAVKDGKLMATRIEPGAPAVGLVRTASELFVGCMDSTLHSYDIKGRRNWSIAVASPISAMCRMLVRRTGAPANCCAIALEGGEVRIFASGSPNGNRPAARLVLPETITGMQFGQYGRECNTLVMVSKSGALALKILKRTAQFVGVGAEKGSAQPLAGAAAAAGHIGGGSVSVPGITIDESLAADLEKSLVIPKKSRVYIEQTQREREQAPQMHRAFQRDLCKLRLTTAQTYLKILSNGGLQSSVGGVSFRLNGEVLGLGPSFKLKLELVNVGKESIIDCCIVFSFKKELYQMSRPLSRLDLVVPSVTYALEYDIRSIDESGAADSVQCMVCRGQESAPCVLLLISMPPSQQAME